MERIIDESDLDDVQSQKRYVCVQHCCMQDSDGLAVGEEAGSTAHFLMAGHRC